MIDGTGWHRGVIGIVASRLVEKYERPAIVISVEEGVGRGSGRSIKSFHLYNALQSCEIVLEEFGGHAQAAGLTVLEKNIPVLRDKINAFALENLPPEALKRQVSVDMELKLSELSGRFLEELELLEPYGMGNPRPVFKTGDLELKSKPRCLYGETYEVVLTDGLVNYQAQLNEKQMMACVSCGAGARFEAAYSVKTKQWNGMKTLILSVKEFREGSLT